mgnify:CR=1 FL=1
MILIGYARVSTINQNEDRQIQELIKYGVEEKRIYIDKQSGKDFHRPSYMKMTDSAEITEKFKRNGES